MKYYNKFYAPSIEILSREADHSVSKVTLPQGEGKLSKTEYDIVVRSEVVHAFVRDGYLDFPDCPVMGPMHGQTLAERIEREKELFNADPEEPDVAGDLTELTELVGKQASELADSKKFNADLVQQNADMLKRLAALEKSVASPAATPVTSAAPAPTTATTPATPIASPATPAAAPAPAAAPPAPPKQ